MEVEEDGKPVTKKLARSSNPWASWRKRLSTRDFASSTALTDNPSSVATASGFRSFNTTRRNACQVVDSKSPSISSSNRPTTC
jgi:hypothetical protein